MPTLTAGQSATLTVPVDGIVTVQPNNGACTYESPVGTVVGGPFTYMRSFGPVTAISTTKLTCVTGTCYYEQGTITNRQPVYFSDSTHTDLVAADGTQATLDPAEIPALAASTGAGLVGFQQAGTGAVATTAQAKAREIVSLEDYFVAGAADWSTASTNACLYCWQTGATLRLKGQAYPGARIEVHGAMHVEGNGATVDYLGVGTTYIAGTGTGTNAAPTAWPNDPAYDPAGNFNPVMYTLAATIAVGDTSFQVVSAAGLAAGQYLFVGGNPTNVSSAGNYIPTDFEFVRVASVVGTTVNILGAFKNAYTTIGTGAGAAAAFYSAGLATNGRVTGLKVGLTTGAYQFVVRSAMNVQLDGIEFVGTTAVGAATFCENLRINGWKVHSSNGPLSTARGTVSAYIDGIEYMEGSGGPTGVFLEESLYRVSLRNVNARNAAFSIRSMPMATGQGKRLVTLDGCVFDAKSDSPFQCGTAQGFDLIAAASTFVGTVITPNASSYPGVTGSALTWVASTLATDVWKFNACQFSGTAGVSFTAGSGVQGKVLFDKLCTFNTVTAPVTKYTPRGIWNSLALTAPFTAISSYSPPSYRCDGYDVFLAGSVQVNSASSGSVVLTMPVGFRPPANKLLVSGSGQTGAAAAANVMLSLSSSGDLTATWEPGVAYFSLENISFALDV